MAIEFGPKLGFAVHADLNENWYDELTRLLRGIDALVQLTVISHASSDPPSGPADGDVHIVGPSANDDWAGHEREVARWSTKESTWEFYEPLDGWLAWSASTQGYLTYKTVGGWAVFPPEAEPEVPPSARFAAAYLYGELDTEFFTTLTQPEDQPAAAVGFPESTGKRYVEFIATSLPASATSVEMGFVGESVLPSLEDGSAWGGYWFPGGGTDTFLWTSFGIVKQDGSTIETITGYDDTVVFGMAVDLDARKAWPMIDGVAVTGDPEAGTGGYTISASGSLRPFIGSKENGVTRDLTIFAGSDSQVNLPPTGFTPWFTP